MATPLLDHSLLPSSSPWDTLGDDSHRVATRHLHLALRLALTLSPFAQGGSR